MNEVSGPLADKAADKRREHKRFSENHYNRAQTLAAWLLATLVAVNTSAAAAIIATVKDADRQPAVAFAAGVASAVASGMFSWGEAFKHSDYHYGEIQEKLNKADRSRQESSKKLAPFFASAAVTLNIVSLAFFVAGYIWSARAL